MEAIIRFMNLGNRVDGGTAPVSGGTPINALGDPAPATTGVNSNPNIHRQAINITNHSSTDGIWVYLSQSDTAPTLSATTWTVRVPPNDNRTIAAGSAVRCWILSESASNTCSYSALELL